MDMRPNEVKLAGELYTLSSEEVAGLGRICLAINSYDTEQYLAGYKKGVHPSLSPYLHSVKVANSAELPDRESPSNIHRVDGYKLASLLHQSRLEAVLLIRASAAVLLDFS
jgi:hypothetical protein